MILRWGAGHLSTRGPFPKNHVKEPGLGIIWREPGLAVSQEELVASRCYKTADMIFIALPGLTTMESDILAREEAGWIR